MSLIATFKLPVISCHLHLHVLISLSSNVIFSNNMLIATILSHVIDCYLHLHVVWFVSDCFFSFNLPSFATFIICHWLLPSFAYRWILPSFDLLWLLFSFNMPLFATFIIYDIDCYLRFSCHGLLLYFLHVIDCYLCLIRHCNWSLPSLHMSWKASSFIANLACKYTLLPI